MDGHWINSWICKRRLCCDFSISVLLTCSAVTTAAQYQNWSTTAQSWIPQTEPGFPCLPAYTEQGGGYLNHTYTYLLYTIYKL